MKKCTRCKILKDESEFYNRSASERATRHQKLQSNCKSCMTTSKKNSRSDPAKRKEELDANKTRRTNNPEKAKAVDRVGALKQHYGITVQQYEHLFTTQNGLCAICGQPESSVLDGKIKRLAVDHDHVTGKVRGLLCGRCNTAIGLFRDDIDIMSLAVCYLLKPIQNLDESTPSFRCSIRPLRSLSPLCHQS